MYLHEEILLLALRDETGKIDWQAANFRTAMAGAIVAELLLAGRIAVDDRSKLVTVVNTDPVDSTVLNEALESLDTAKGHSEIDNWIVKLASMEGLKQKTAAALCDRGILRTEEVKLLFVFSSTRYPELDPAPERQLIERLRAAIFSDDEVDIRTTLLISLGHPSGLLAVPFSRSELRQRKERIQEITQGDMVGEATAAAIEAMQAAIAATAIAGSTSVSAGSPSC